MRVSTSVCVCGRRILQYGQMSQTSETSEGDNVVKSQMEASGDQGLLNLLTDDTVFYVGGYPSSFRVGTGSTAPPCWSYGSCCDVLSVVEEKTKPVRKTQEAVLISSFIIIYKAAYFVTVSLKQAAVVPPKL